jgi:hypothetical protein
MPVSESSSTGYPQVVGGGESPEPGGACREPLYFCCISGLLRPLNCSKTYYELRRKREN